MRHIYIAASWREVERAKRVARALRGAGYDVWAFWEEHPEPLSDDALEEWERTDPEHPEATARYLRLRRMKLDCLLAIREAGCVVLVEPAGNDAHYECGFALAEEVPVVQIGRGRPGLMTFDAARATDETTDLLGLVTACAGAGRARYHELMPADSAAPRGQAVRP